LLRLEQEYYNSLKKPNQKNLCDETEAKKDVIPEEKDSEAKNSALAERTESENHQSKESENPEEIDCKKNQLIEEKF
jgi:hypothetical protein